MEYYIICLCPLADFERLDCVWRQFDRYIDAWVGTRGVCYLDVSTVEYRFD
jgi:hypothetical protein